MQYETPLVTPELIKQNLDQLKIAKEAYDLAETNWNFIIKQRFPQAEVRQAFLRKKQTSAHYEEVSEWLLRNTPHGFLYDEDSGIFKLR